MLEPSQREERNVDKLNLGFDSRGRTCDKSCDVVTHPHPLEKNALRFIARAAILPYNGEGVYLRYRTNRVFLLRSFAYKTTYMVLVFVYISGATECLLTTDSEIILKIMKQLL